MIVGMLCLKNASSQSTDMRSGSMVSVTFSVVPTPYSTYEWFISGGKFDTPPNGSSVNVTWDLLAKKFRLGVLETTVHGCKGDTVWYEEENGRVIFPFIYGNRLACEGEELTLTASSADSIYKNIVYKWSTGETSQTIKFRATKTTNISCILYYNGDALDTAFATIEVLPIPRPDFTWTPLFPKRGEEVTFKMKKQNYPFDFYWIINGQSDSIASSEYTTTLDSGGVNKIGLYMKNDLGCDNVKYYSINIDKEYPFNIPQVFSPNDDGVNDVLNIELPEDLRSCEFRIFNRWGTEVFTSNSISEIQWDGKFNGNVLADGAYIYQIVAYANNNKYLHQNGTIAITR